MSSRIPALARLASLSLALLVGAAPVHAETPDERPLHGASLTFSPLHLLLPIAEIQGEFRLTPHIGLAVIGGIGSVTVETATSESTLTAYEVGGKFVGYVVGDFDEGLQVGLEVLYAGVGGTAQDDVDTVAVFGEGLGLTPLIGYKIITDIGFTFEAQAGPSLTFVSARSSNHKGETEVSVGPMLNLNIGWSF